MIDQWTVGDLVDALEKAPATYWLVFEWGHLKVCSWDSYRGSYDEIGISAGERSYEPHDNGFVGPVLEALKKDLAEATVFGGWKGGDYTFQRDRLLWVAAAGETSRTMVTGLRLTRYDERAGLAEILTEQGADE